MTVILSIDPKKRALQALGRLKAGAMNKTEAAYDKTLADRKHAGEIVWYRFEGIKLRLADNTFYTPDFAVMLADGQMECHGCGYLSARTVGLYGFGQAGIKGRQKNGRR